MDKLDISGFSSQGYNRSYRRVTRVETDFSQKSAPRDTGFAVQLLLGCAACGVLAFAALGDGGAFDKVKRAVSYQASIDETLGTLSYVKEGAAEVFGWRSLYEMPVSGAAACYSTAGGALSVEGAPECDVASCCEGEVTQTGEGFARVRQGDLQLEYGNLSFVCVSPGQILERGEIIGRTGEDGTLLLSVEKNGCALDAADTLGFERR